MASNDGWPIAFRTWPITANQSRWGGRRRLCTRGASPDRRIGARLPAADRGRGRTGHRGDWCHPEPGGRGDSSAPTPKSVVSVKDGIAMYFPPPWLLGDHVVWP